MDRTTLVYRNVSEIINKEKLSKLLENDTPVGYIGFAPTGKIHLGYLVPCMKIKDLTLANCRIAIMIADMHAMIDERKTPKHLVELRSEYYRRVLTCILEKIGANMLNIKFISGSEFQLQPQYNLDVWDLSGRLTIGAAKKAGSEVVKQDKDPKLSSLLYPIMQVIDEKFVGPVAYQMQTSFELGGIDQKKIFCLSYDHNLSENEKLTYLMTPIISLAKTGKMSASGSAGKINLTDTEEDIQREITKAYCPNADPECGIMILMKVVFFPLEGIIQMEKTEYTDYETFENDFKNGIFDARDLKKIVIVMIEKILCPIKNYLLTNNMRKLVADAYPY